MRIGFGHVETLGLFKQTKHFRVGHIPTVLDVPVRAFRIHACQDVARPLRFAFLDPVLSIGGITHGL